MIKCNPTRMELNNIKKRLVTARRGHRLLKDKRDELMRKFLDMVKDTRRIRERGEAGIKQSNSHMQIARSLMRRQVLDTALINPRQQLLTDVDYKNIMSVITPVLKGEFSSFDEQDTYSYGYAFTSADLDESIASINAILPDMLRLAEAEKTCQMLSAEIEKTRRRVNALEYVMIPQYEQAIRYITMKLDENERSANARLLKIKDKMIEQAHGANFE